MSLISLSHTLWRVLHHCVLERFVCVSVLFWCCCFPPPHLFFFFYSQCCVDPSSCFQLLLFVPALWTFRCIDCVQSVILNCAVPTLWLRGWRNCRACWTQNFISDKQNRRLMAWPGKGSFPLQWFAYPHLNLKKCECKNVKKNIFFKWGNCNFLSKYL